MSMEAGKILRHYLVNTLRAFTGGCRISGAAAAFPAASVPGNTGRDILEQFQFETLRVSNHTACRFAEKARFFRSLWAGRRCAAASRFTFFKGEAL